MGKATLDGVVRLGPDLSFRLGLGLAACLIIGLICPAKATDISDMAGIALDSPLLDGQVARSEPGPTLVLKDGRRLVLAGIWPLRRLHDGADGIENALAIMMENRLQQLTSIRFFLSAPTSDRYNRFKAYILDDQDHWLSLTLLEEGLVYAFPVGERPEIASALYAAEAKARARNKGLWAHPPLSVQSAQTVTAPAGTFAVIKGPIAMATKVAGTVYLNFGMDWRQDFTTRLVWPLRRQYPKSERTAEWWQGRTIEVRGMLESYNGPMITPLHPAQIRLLSQPQTASSLP